MSLCSPTSSEDYTFQVLDNVHTRWGQQLFATTADVIRPGIIVMFSGTSGSVTNACDGATRPIGIAYGSRHSVYRPTDQCYDADEPHVVLTGRGHAALGVSLFTGGSHPNLLNQKIYAGANGLWTTVAGTYPVGRYLGAYYHWTGSGTQTQSTLSHVEFDIPAFTNP
jgi:hypothetical protein